MDGSKGSPIVWFDDYGNGPHEHVCAGGGPVDRIEAWVARAKLLGLHPEAEKAIAEMVEDIR
jgi:hypothetical protein